MDLLSLNDEFCEHSRYMLGYSDATIRRYATTVRLFRGMMAVTEIEECTDERVREFFYRGRRERQWTASSFVTYRKSLLVFIRWCVGRGHLPANPVEAIEVPRQPKTLPPKLSEQEARRLLEHVRNHPYSDQFLRHRNHAIFATFLLAGLRKSELLKLAVVDVDLVNCSILVRKGKGSKDRIVPISATLAGLLRLYAHQRTRLGKSCPEFFASFSRNMGLTNDGLKHLVMSLRSATGRRFTVHQLRHTFATLMLEGGSDIYSVSRMLGHSDIRTTTIYLAATPEHLRRQVARHPLSRG